MVELFNIESQALCFILSADPSELNSIQLAIRRALEDGNAPEVLEAMRQRACLLGELDIFSVNSEGNIRRRM